MIIPCIAGIVLQIISLVILVNTKKYQRKTHVAMAVLYVIGTALTELCLIT